VFEIIVFIFASRKNADGLGNYCMTLFAGGLAVLARSCFLGFATPEYGDVFSPWIDALRNGSSSGLSLPIGDSNAPHMYLLYVFSKIRYPDLLTMKIASMCFDIMLAYFAMKLALLCSKKESVGLAAFILILFAPTVLLNSSFWGQCDSIYASFSLAGLYFGLKKNSKACFALAGLAVSFKLQAAILLPAYFALILGRRIKLRDCWAFFGTFVFMHLPAVAAGRGIAEILESYIGLISMEGQSWLNAASIWTFVQNVDMRPFNTAGVIIALLFTATLLFFCYKCRYKISSHFDCISLAFLFSLTLPFLLPNMRERSYYLADVLSIMLFLCKRKFWWVPIATIFCSVQLYANYLTGHMAISPEILSIALGLLSVLMVRDFIYRIHFKKEKLPKPRLAIVREKSKALLMPSAKNTLADDKYDASLGDSIADVVAKIQLKESSGRLDIHLRNS
jgi:Gpi18-like mannosyltransferase